MIKVTQGRFKLAKQEGDGICVYCKSWSYGNAEPLAECRYCEQCDNRSVAGVEKARQLGLIEVET
jgi:hypothetical protein